MRLVDGDGDVRPSGLLELLLNKGNTGLDEVVVGLAGRDNNALLVENVGTLDKNGLARETTNIKKINAHLQYEVLKKKAVLVLVLRDGAQLAGGLLKDLVENLLTSGKNTKTSLIGDV